MFLFSWLSLSLFSVSILNVADTATIHDLPNEMLLNILEHASNPFTLKQVSHRFHQLPLPCRHYPTLLQHALSVSSRRHPSALSYFEKVVAARKSPVTCFGTHAMEMALAANQTRVVSALWMRKGELSAQELTSWFGESGSFFALLHGHLDIFNFLYQEGMYTNSRAPTLENIESWFKRSQGQPKVWGEVFTQLKWAAEEGVTPIDHPFVVAAAMSNQPVILSALQSLSPSFQPSTFSLEAASISGACETLNALSCTLDLLPTDRHITNILIPTPTSPLCPQRPFIKRLLTPFSAHFRQQLFLTAIQSPTSASELLASIAENIQATQWVKDTFRSYEKQQHVKKAFALYRMNEERPVDLRQGCAANRTI
jgi:hypothetical protein